MRWFFIVAALLFLIGCANKDTVGPITVTETQSQTPIVLPPPVNMLPVQTGVLNSQGVEDLAAKLRANPDKEFVMIWMTVDSYQNLAINMERIQRYIEQQRALIIQLYRKDKIDAEPAPAVK